MPSTLWSLSHSIPSNLLYLQVSSAIVSRIDHSDTIVMKYPQIIFSKGELLKEKKKKQQRRRKKERGIRENREVGKKLFSYSRDFFIQVIIFLYVLQSARNALYINERIYSLNN